MVITAEGEELIYFYNPRLKRWIGVIRDAKTKKFKRWVKEFTIRATASVETGGGHEPFLAEITMLFPVKAGISPKELEDYSNKAEQYLKALTYVLFDIFKDAFWMDVRTKQMIRDFQRKEVFTLKELLDIFRIVFHARRPEEYIYTKVKWSERVQKVGWEYLEGIERELREELSRKRADIAFDFELRVGTRKSHFRRYLRLEE